METIPILIREAEQLYNKGSYEKAFLLFLQLAEQGNVCALFRIGNMYHYGEGVPIDYGEAVKYYRLAIEKGHKRACHYLALMYYQGKGVKKDVMEAARLLKMSMGENPEEK